MFAAASWFHDSAPLTAESRQRSRGASNESRTIFVAVGPKPGRNRLRLRQCRQRITSELRLADWSKTPMHCVLALGLSITLCSSVNAATAHRPNHLRTRQPAIVGQSHGGAAPRFAVPGWTDEQTRQWLDNASSSWVNA
jgi:hypothetical protein